MSYKIHITQTAERDLTNAADYIEFTLKNPYAADVLLDEASRQIETLADFPQRIKPIDDPVLSALAIRFIAIKNYLAFYVVSEETKQVIIVRFLYAKRDWISILKQGFPLI